VWIVAVRALDQAFVDAVVKGHLEFSLLRQMASVAKVRLRFGQQEFLRRGVVRRVAGNAAHAVLGMHGIQSVHVLAAARVAGHTSVVDFLGRCILECEDFRNVAPACHMGRPRTVTGFASLMRRAISRVKRGLPVRGLGPIVVDFCVAGFANFCAHIRGLCGLGWMRTSHGSGVRVCRT